MSECPNQDGLVSLRRGFYMQIGIQVLGLFFAAISGIALIVHVDPRLECLIFCYQERGKLQYGNYEYCETIGSLLLIAAMMMVYLVFITAKEARECSRQISEMTVLIEPTVPWKLIIAYICVALVTLALVSLVVSGFIVSCQSFEQYIRTIIEDKLSIDPVAASGASFEELYFDDPLMNRYVVKVTNAYGANLRIIKTPCRELIRDFDVHKELHQSLVEKYSVYFGYFFQNDLNSHDYQFGAIKNGLLIETCLTCCCASGLTWLIGLGLLGWHLAVAKTRFRKEKLSTETEESQELVGRSRSLSRASLFSTASSTRRDIDSLVINSLLSSNCTINNLTSPSNSRRGSEVSRHSFSQGRNSFSKGISRDNSTVNFGGISVIPENVGVDSFNDSGRISFSRGISLLDNSPNADNSRMGNRRSSYSKGIARDSSMNSLIYNLNHAKRRKSDSNSYNSREMRRNSSVDSYTHSIYHDRRRKSLGNAIYTHDKCMSQDKRISKSSNFMANLEKRANSFSMPHGSSKDILNRRRISRGDSLTVTEINGAKVWTSIDKFGNLKSDAHGSDV